jgi:hypothetical protein
MYCSWRGGGSIGAPSPRRREERVNSYHIVRFTPVAAAAAEGSQSW